MSRFARHISGREMGAEAGRKAFVPPPAKPKLVETMKNRFFSEA